jgi:hypothetical protein
MSEVIPGNGGIPDDGSPPGHVEKMAGMSEPKETPADDQQVEAPVRPDNIPEKFWDAEKGEVNVEALLKAQQDAEKALRQGQQPADDEVPAEGDQSEQDNVVEAASAEFAEKGELTGDTYEALNKVGISKEMVDSYISGQLAVVDKLRNSAYSPFDGQEGYEAAADWAAANLSETEIQALDVQLTSTNPDIVAEGAKALASRYQAEADVEPGTIRGNANSGVTGGYYKSSGEMMKDMSSRQYRTDSAFRAEVAAKIERAERAGVNLFT